MKKLNNKEMRSIDGGATYSKSCRYCGKKTSYKYWELIGWIAAQLIVTSANRSHEISCARSKYGI